MRPSRDDRGGFFVSHFHAQRGPARAAGTESIPGRCPIRSRARGTHQASSDADLAVVLDGDHAERSRISGEMAEIAFDILMETGLLVQAVPLWESEWRHPERFPNPTLIASIRRDGVRL